jgi:hypothetical protein
VLDVELVKALANDKRLLVLEWLRDPEAHFPPQRDGDLISDGSVRSSSQTSSASAANLWRASEGAQPGWLIHGKKIKQWVFYQRDENRIAEAKELLGSDW